MPGGVVTTIRDKCKRCYTCIRSCPAKAIKVEDGQAVVVEPLCVGCGNCIKVCAQSAKAVESSIGEVQRLLGQPAPIVACLAPSFPAAFQNYPPGQIISAIRVLGFEEVMEVAVGAELVAREYSELARDRDARPLIATPCPAVVFYIQRHAPALVPYLAPVVSPMIAIGRAVKERYRPGARTVFIGPCTAKKAEIRDPEVAGAIDVVLTFVELQEMFLGAGIRVEHLPESDFDGPRPGVGRIFPVAGGLLRTAGIRDDVLDSRVVVTEGVERVPELIKEIEAGHVQAKFYDLLLCNGCIDGPLMGNDLSPFARKEIIASYTSSRSRTEGRERPCKLSDFEGLDLKRKFVSEYVDLPMPTEEEIRRILIQINKNTKEDELNCGACGYDSCREKAVAVYRGLAELEMCLPYLIEQLQASYLELESSHHALREAEEKLIQSTKLASMGQLAAGIAHELNNPLGSIMLYSHMLMKTADPGSTAHEDMKLIADEAARCKEIVSGLLDFARRSRVKTRATGINELVSETLDLLSKQPAFAKVELKREFDPDLPQIPVDAPQIKQAFINLMTNAAEAMAEGGTLTIRTYLCDDGQMVGIQFCDTGSGIPKENLGKLFTPFFTTKQLGKGTGLGLAITYGIVKMHRGGIDVQSTVGKGTCFTITLPRTAPTKPAKKMLFQ